MIESSIGTNDWDNHMELIGFHHNALDHEVEFLTFMYGTSYGTAMFQINQVSIH